MWVFSSPFEEGEICNGCYATLGNLVKEWMTGGRKLLAGPVRLTESRTMLDHDTQ
jgi:uncharacterized protein involved in propanediol utilization